MKPLQASSGKGLRWDFDSGNLKSGCDFGLSLSYGRVCTFIRRWKTEINANPKRSAYVPLSFALGEAFQFD